MGLLCLSVSKDGGDGWTGARERVSLLEQIQARTDAKETVARKP